MKLREKYNSDICKENNMILLTNIVEENTTKNKIRGTLEIIAKTLCGTLGPYGSSTVIQDRGGQDFATKDGYDLMNKISFDDEVSRTILNIVRQIASSQVLNVGDGSTSAIIVANALYSVLNDNLDEDFQKLAGKDITDILNDIGKIIEEKIKEISRPLSDDFHELDDVAGISLNNDFKTGEKVAEIYKKIGKFGFITTDITGTNPEDEYEIKKGIEWKRGAVDDTFIENKLSKKTVYSNSPRVILFKNPITYDDINSYLIPLIKNSLTQADAELLIVANEYTDDVLTFLKSNRTKHLSIGGPKTPELKFAAVDIDQVTSVSINNLIDLSLLLGCEIVDKFSISPEEVANNPNRFIGIAEKITVSPKSTQIVASEVLENETQELRKNQALEELKTKAEELSKIDNPEIEEENELYETKRRISNLTNSSAIFKVGGKTQAERMTRERLIEDAIFACKSAIEYGIIEGGNLTVPKLLLKYEDEIIQELTPKYFYLKLDSKKVFFKKFLKKVENAFLDSYRNVLNNSYLTEKESESIISKCLKKDLFYNLKLHEFEDSKETTVINSAMTDIQIMNTTFSIIGILATSNQFITINIHTMDEHPTPKEICLNE